MQKGSAEGEGRECRGKGVQREGNADGKEGSGGYPECRLHMTIVQESHRPISGEMFTVKPSPHSC